MNVVLIIIDTLRQDHVGCYGNHWIKTPYLDSLAKESMLFTHAYPESLPTLQVRRVLQTGCRIFPFLGHKDYKGNLFIGSPGWGPFVMVRDRRYRPCDFSLATSGDEPALFLSFSTFFRR